MRSVCFQRPLEYQISTETEEWNQGDPVQGKLRIRNMSEEAITLEGLSVQLAYGYFKKLKAGEEDALQLMEEIPVVDSQDTIEASQQQIFPWEFKLPTDCPITDKQGSLFLLFGQPIPGTRQGRIDLKIHLMPILKNFLQTFETQFRFSRKYEKSSEGWTEIKLVPPTSKEFPTLEHVLCLVRMRETKLEIQYKFKVKSFGRSGNDLKVTGKTRIVEQQIGPEEYLQPGGFPNRNAFKSYISEALEMAKPGALA